MTNLEKLNKAFCEAFEVEEAQLKGLEYQAVETWDSVGHMTLVAALEEVFDIMMEMDDIIDMSSYEKAIALMGKYDIDMSA